MYSSLSRRMDQIEKLERQRLPIRTETRTWRQVLRDEPAAWKQCMRASAPIRSPSANAVFNESNRNT